MRWLTAILIFVCSSTFAQNPILKRICRDPNNNTIYWTNPVYPCSNFHFYIIWASRNGTDFYPVDTSYTATSELHVHLNANSTPGIPNQFYYVERRDSCGPDYNHYSQTLEIDQTNPPATFLDSVSVDILTNKVVLGWSKNQLPDFNRYFTYWYDNNDAQSIDPAGLRDTFQIDNTGNNPSLGSRKYDINTTDSCGNPSTFGSNPHSTIYLINKVDSCDKTTTLNWSHYKGWNLIEQYYIFQDSGTGYFLQDSVIGTENTFTTNITLGLNYRFYVRAKKGNSPVLITSSSNVTQFTTRKRIDPSFVNIDYITTDALSEKVVLNFTADANGETKEFVADAFLNNTLLQTLIYTISDIGTDLNTNLDWNTQYTFKVSAINECDQTTLQTDSSTNIVLDSIKSTDRVLSWNSYFTWNTGIEKYIIYRGTGEGNFYTFANWKETTDTFATDTATYNNALSNGVCYYIKAIKSGSTGISSESNILCFPNPFVVFIPNAFVPDGVNSIFRPGGSSIDFKLSRIEIYDRWGKKIYDDFINQGWDGKDQNGQPYASGVYFYRAEMISIRNEKQIKNGSFTLLR